MVKFIWQHNLPIYGIFKKPPGFLGLKGQKMRPPVTAKLKVREVSQRKYISERNKWFYA